MQLVGGTGAVYYCHVSDCFVGHLWRAPRFCLLITKVRSVSVTDILFITPIQYHFRPLGYDMWYAYLLRSRRDDLTHAFGHKGRGARFVRATYLIFLLTADGTYRPATGSTVSILRRAVSITHAGRPLIRCRAQLSPS